MKHQNSSGKMTGVIIIEKDEQCLKDVRNALNNDPEMKIIGECMDLSGATALLTEDMKEAPHVIIACFDILKEAVASDVKALMALKDRMAGTKLIVTGERFADEEIFRMINEGIRGFFLKETPSDLITRCIRVVTSGGIWMDNSFIARVFEEVSRRNETAGSQDCLSGN